MALPARPKWGKSKANERIQTDRSKAGWRQASDSDTVVYVPSVARAPKESVVVLQEGLVVLRQFLSLDEQQWFVDETFRIGNGEAGVGGGFFVKEGKMMKLNRGDKGRVIAPISDFDERYKLECLRVLEAACAADASLPRMDPNVVLVNFYSDKSSGLGWHRDNDESRERACKQLGRPVVSLSIGDSTDFGYKNHYDDPESIVQLNSGDALVFGGPSRMVVHSVLGIKPGTKPMALRLRSGRLNITYRDHTEVEDSEINLGYDGDNRLLNSQSTAAGSS